MKLIGRRWALPLNQGRVVVSSAGRPAGQGLAADIWSYHRHHHDRRYVIVIIPVARPQTLGVRPKDAHFSCLLLRLAAAYRRPHQRIGQNPAKTAKVAIFGAAVREAPAALAGGWGVFRQPQVAS